MILEQLDKQLHQHLFEIEIQPENIITLFANNNPNQLLVKFSNWISKNIGRVNNENTINLRY
jgi:hypothetical protein